MDQKVQLKLVSDFLSQQNLGVLATVTSAGLPEAAVIGFVQKNDFEIIFATFDESRKFHNLQSNPRVALAVGWERGITVQYEGEAAPLTDAEVEECKRLFLAKIPTAAKFVSSPSEKFFRITPKWVRYSDWSHDPIEQFEIRF